MKRNYKIILLVFIGLGLLSCKSTNSKKETIKVMTYNIHYGMDSNFTNRGDDSALDQVVEYIEHYNLDIVLLQEFPQGSKKFASYLNGDRKNPIKFLEKRLGGKYYIEEVIKRDGNKYIGGQSLVIVSKYDILEKHTLSLPQPLYHQTRKVLLVKLKINNSILWVSNTHLFYLENIMNYNDLVSSLQWMNEKVAPQESLIFGGDLNFDEVIDTVERYKDLTEETDGKAKYNLIKNQNFKDAYIDNEKKRNLITRNTFISNNKKPDYLFFKNLSCSDYFHGDSNSSDHYPVFSEFYFNSLERE